MSFDSTKYPNRKDNRRRYLGKTSKNFDRTCRNHGSCSHCESNRLINTRRTLAKAKDMLKDLE
ncbi:hypothetical protein D3C87_278530 [compost metagenome]